ncbi:hypothetical protein [Lentzea sp. E54]|uniref:hypothetical protein n=1 Tax=Lentzea xerophila TaxID=3435883 RepID=UPI003DA37791
MDAVFVADVLQETIKGVVSSNPLRVTISWDLLTHGGLTTRKHRILMDEHLGVQLDLISERELARGDADRADVEHVEAGWSYLWEGARSGGRNLFSSQVSRIGGAEGERRRLELIAVVRELLHHAERRTQAGDGAERWA